MSKLLKYAKALRPSLVLKGTVYALDTPFNHVVRGICLDRSSLSKHYYVSVFHYFPVVPIHFMYLSHGHRLGPNNNSLFTDQTENDIRYFEEQILKDAIPFIDKRIEFNQALDLMVKYTKGKEFKNNLEQCAYGLALAGDYKSSLKYIDKIISSTDPNDRREWVRNDLKNIEKLKEAINEGHDAAQKLLLENEQQSLIDSKIHHIYGFHMN